MLSFAGSALSAQPTVNLGNADSFGALSFTAMTNAGANTVVHGDIGSSTSIDAGVTHPGYGAYGPGTPELANAQASLLTAYNFAEAQAPTQPSITGVNLGGDTLLPGVYNSTGGILIDDPIPLTLDGNGDSSSVFIFQAASSGNLIVESTSSIVYTNGAQPCNVFWKVNSAFLRNTNFTFIGTILALTQITLTENITVEGRVLARNADVTFIHDTIIKPTCATPSPTPPPPVAGVEVEVAEVPDAEESQQRTDWQQAIVAPNGTPLPPRVTPVGAADAAQAEAEAAREHLWSDRLSIAGRTTVRITSPCGDRDALCDLDRRSAGNGPPAHGREAEPGVGGSALLAQGVLEALQGLDANRAGVVATADHRGTNRASRARAQDRPRRASVATRQAPRAPERKNGLDQPTRDGCLADELAPRRRHVLAAGDRLPARPPARVFSAIVGHVSTPTPTGAFFVEESIQMPR